MSKFILLYKGPATPMDQMTPEMGAQQVEAWKNWMAKVGSNLVDIGSPMANGKSLSDTGEMGAALDLNGYSIVQAETMDDVLKFVEGHPFLRDKSGKFSVEVFELMPLPM